MSQKLRLPNIGSKTIINGLLKPILSPKSQILRDKMSLARYFAYIASSGFTGGWFSNLPVRQLIISHRRVKTPDFQFLSDTNKL